MSNQPDGAVTAFLILLAGALLEAGIPAMLKTSAHRGRAWACIALATVLFLAGYYWSSFTRPALGPMLTASVEALATDAWVWLCIILLLLFYTMTENIIQTIKDKKTIGRDTAVLYAALDAYVLPRSLTPREQGIIAKHLSSLEPHEVTFELIENDHEASNFYAAIRNAVDQGGWTIKGWKRVEKLEQGLAIHAQRPQAVGESRRPKPEDVLREAFRRANVVVDGGMSSGGGVAIIEEVITIRIGPRRRDAGVLRALQ